MLNPKKRRIKKTDHLLRDYEDGRSLTELLGVLAVVGIVAAGSVVGFDTMHTYWQNKETADQVLTAGTRYAVNHVARIRTSTSSSGINIKDVMPEATNSTSLNTADGGSIQMYAFTAGASAFEVSAKISDTACDMILRSGGYPLVLGTNGSELGNDSGYKAGTTRVYTPDCFTSDNAAKECDSSVQTVNQLVNNVCAKTYQHFIWDPAAPKSGTTYFYGGSSHYCPSGTVVDQEGYCCEKALCGGLCDCPSGQYCLTSIDACVECDVTYDRVNGTNEKCDGTDRPYCVDNHCYECKKFGDDDSCPDTTTHKGWCSWGFECVDCNKSYQIFNEVSGSCVCTTIPDRVNNTCTAECGCDYGLTCTVSSGQVEGKCQCTSSDRSVLDADCNNQDCRCESSKGLICSNWNKCACPANTTWVDSRCCNNTNVYTGTDGLQHCCDTAVSGGHCCTGGTTWVGGECCPSNRIYQEGGVNQCCSEVVSNGHCCTGGKVWKEHICCFSTESEVQDSNGAYHCCANNAQYWWLSGSNSKCCPITKTSGSCADNDCPCTNGTDCSYTYTSSFTNNARNKSTTTTCCTPLASGSTCSSSNCACASGTECKKVYNSSFGLSNTTKCCGENTGACVNGGCPCTTGSCNQYYANDTDLSANTDLICCTPKLQGQTCGNGECKCANGHCSNGYCCPDGQDWVRKYTDSSGSLSSTYSCCQLLSNNTACGNGTCACQSGNCTNGHCCATNSTWVDGACCLNTNIYTGADRTQHCCSSADRIYEFGGAKYCCETELHNGQCCTDNKVWKGHTCCFADQVEVQHADGDWHCCSTGEQWWKKVGTTTEKCCPITKTSGSCADNDCPCTNGTDCSYTYTSSFTNNARNKSTTTQCCVPATTTCSANGCACADDKECKKVYDSSFGLSTTTKCCGNNTGACVNGGCPCTTGSCHQVFGSAVLSKGVGSITGYSYWLKSTDEHKCVTPKTQGQTCTTGDACVTDNCACVGSDGATCKCCPQGHGLKPQVYPTRDNTNTICCPYGMRANTGRSVQELYAQNISGHCCPYGYTSWFSNCPVGKSGMSGGCCSTSSNPTKTTQVLYPAEWTAITS